MDRERLTLDEIRRAIAFEQPKLNVAQVDKFFVVEGQFLVHEDVQGISSDGPITEFDIRIILCDRYPSQEPVSYETAGRIPREFDRHIVNDKGACCVIVWEEWLAEANDLSFTAYLNGPLREFFLSQYWFEKTNTWPFGERSHFKKGLVEAYADVLKIPNKEKSVNYYLRLLSQDWPKGHWLCPCGSKKLLRYCCKEHLRELHQRIPSALAKRMLKRLMVHSQADRKRYKGPQELVA